MEITNLSLLRKRAKQFKQLRDELMRQLYPTTKNFGTTSDPTAAVLTNLFGSFQRFAGNQQTAYDNGSVGSSATSTANQLERQVERAITQVLGRAPGRGADAFINALNDTFPVSSDGRQIVFTPSRSAVNLYNSNGNGNPNGLAGQLSAQQAALYRQTSIVAGDALKILASLKSFVPDADAERVESLRMVISSEIKALVDEFGRIDEPRPERVKAYLDGLATHIAELGDRAFLNDPTLVATVDDEAQTTGFELLRNYIRTMRTAWNEFNRPDRPQRFTSLSERLERANVLLPILAQGNTDLEDALDSVGLTGSERRSRAVKFSTLAVPIVGLRANPGSGDDRVFATTNPIGNWLPNITVNDLTDWLDRFSNTEGPSMLSDSGEYGLDFVTTQADQLFWTIAPIIAQLQVASTSTNPSTLARILLNERVRWALDNLLSQLQATADLAA
jgi:hypothetical protein